MYSMAIPFEPLLLPLVPALICRPMFVYKGEARIREVKGGSRTHLCVCPPVAKPVMSWVGMRACPWIYL
jgi:hypothetical protein